MYFIDCTNISKYFAINTSLSKFIQWHIYIIWLFSNLKFSTATFCSVWRKKTLQFYANPVKL